MRTALGEWSVNISRSGAPGAAWSCEPFTAVIASTFTPGALGSVSVAAPAGTPMLDRKM